MKSLFLALCMTTLSCYAWSYTDVCQSQIKANFSKGFDRYGDGSSASMPATFEEAERLVYDYSQHPLDRDKYLAMLRSGSIVVFKSTWSTSMYGGRQLILIDSSSCTFLTFFRISGD